VNRTLTRGQLLAVAASFVVMFYGYVTIDFRSPKDGHRLKPSHSDINSSEQWEKDFVAALAETSAREWKQRGMLPPDEMQKAN